MRAHPGWHIRWTRGNGLHLSWRQGWSTECFLNFSLQMSPCRTMQSWIPWRSSSTGMFGGFQKVIPGIWPNWAGDLVKTKLTQKLQPTTCTQPWVLLFLTWKTQVGVFNRNGLRIFSSQVADAMVQAAGEAPARLGTKGDQTHGTNISLENGWLEDDPFLFGMSHFQGRTCSFSGGGYCLYIFFE